MALNYSQYNYKIYLPLCTIILKFTKILIMDIFTEYIQGNIYKKKLQKNMDFLFNMHTTQFTTSKMKVGRNTSLLRDINE